MQICANITLLSDKQHIILRKVAWIMFDKIQFTTTVSEGRLSSKNTSSGTSQEKPYNTDAVANANVSFWGSVDAFHRPPISDFALKNLYHMQDFDIFHYLHGSYTERKNYDSFLVLYTYSGSGILTYRDKKYTLKEGDGFFINCADYHMYQVADKKWDTATLHINGPLMQDFHDQFMCLGSPIFHEPVTGLFQQHLEQLLELYSTPQLYRDWQVSTCIDNLLIYMLQLSSKHTFMRTEIPENIQYLIHYMENNFEKKMTLDYLAKFSNITKYYLSREFKKYTGFSPNDYLISLRINRAKILLKSTSMPASKIAHEVGIHDMNNFTNLFKKKTGMTPIQYRNTNNQF